MSALKLAAVLPIEGSMAEVEDCRSEKQNAEHHGAHSRAQYINAVNTCATAGLGVVLDAIFPRRCKGCEAFLPFGGLEGFCPACQAHLRFVESPYCLLCGQPYAYSWVEGHLCAECLLRPPPFLRARSWVCYPRDAGPRHPVRRAVYRFKYGRKLSYGKVLGELMARACKARFGKPDLIVPVPLHPKRLRWRGFNQAAVLGKAVSRCWGVPLDSLVLEKFRPTRPQTELSRRERQPNVRGAFSLNPQRSVKGRHLLLIDDIYTSGATVKECTRVLLRGGARTVQVLTLGRTV